MSKQRQTKLRFRAVDSDIFDAIQSGRKKIETRAASPKYQHIKAGERILFVCGKKKFTRTVKQVRRFTSIKSMLEIHSVKALNPSLQTEYDLRKKYYSFPGYREKIKKYGLIAFTL